MKEVILLGSGDSAIDCPFDGTEIWATAKILPRIDPISDCKKVFIVGNAYKRRGSVSLANSANIPIVSVEDYATEPFPLKEITDRFGMCYVRNPLSYMLAYAIHLGYEKMHLFGMDKYDEWEQIPDLPRITYWFGVARGLGIEWTIIPGCRLWAVMQQTVKRRYEAASWKRNLGNHSFMEEAMRHGDPYCFVSGEGRDDITVTSYAGGREVAKWHP